MSELGTTEASNLIATTKRIVAAYVRNNPVPHAELSGVIKSVHATLAGLSGLGSAVIVGNDKLVGDKKPAVPIKKSVTPEYIVCLEDGKHLKMLKRYLRTRYKLTPEEYRARWGLAHDYPIVAPNYAKRRSDLAKKIGLGRVSKSGRKRKR